MRTFKRTLIDEMFLLQSSTDNYTDSNSSSTILINGIDLNNLLQKSNIDLYTPKYDFFISINPMRHISVEKLKEYFHLAYSRYWRFISGKKYRKTEYPILLDFVIEEADNKIKFNHLHILTNTKLSIYDFQLFIGILFCYLRAEIKSINILSENVIDKGNTLSYMLKNHIVGKNKNIVISSNIKLMNQTDL